MDGSSGRVTVQLRQIEGFGNQALAGKGGVSMEQDGDDPRSGLGICKTPLLGETVPSRGAATCVGGVKVWDATEDGAKDV